MVFSTSPPQCARTNHQCSKYFQPSNSRQSEPSAPDRPPDATELGQLPLPSARAPPEHRPPSPQTQPVAAAEWWRPGGSPLPDPRYRWSQGPESAYPDRSADRPVRSLPSTPDDESG